MYDEKSGLLSFFQPGASHLEAALVYASLAIHVFPLSEFAKEPRSGSHAVHDATTRPDQINKWWQEHPNANIGIGLRRSCVVIIDVDPRNGGEDTLEHWEAQFGALPPTYTVDTAGGGSHYYYRVSPDFYDTFADTLPKKLGPGLDLLINGYAVAPPSELANKKQYIATSSPEEGFARAPITWIQKIALEKGIEKDRARWAESQDWSFRVGERNEGMAKIAGYWRRVGFTAQEIFDMLKAIGPKRFEDFAEIEDGEIWKTAKSIASHPPSSVRLDQVILHLKARSRPPELDNRALYGPIGNWVRYITPVTEAHPAALLVQGLVYFGNLIGARQHGDIAPGFSVEGGFHRTALYALIIGDTAKAGKGDSWRRVAELMAFVDRKHRVLSGLQTGEGILDYLADDEPDGTTLHTKHGDEEEVKEGKRKGSRNDRRCMLYEPEFGRILHVSERRGSVIKDVLRDLWDTGESGKITAASKQFITEATVSLVGHITKPELERDYDATDFLTGFGNRFLYCYASRSQHLLSDEARVLTKKELKMLGQPLIEALKFAQEEAPQDMKFTEAAANLWDTQIDVELWKNHPSETINALTQRGRPIVRRMSIIFAIADCSDEIKVQHLRAAYSIWKYCVETAEFAFGDHIGDKDADRVYRALLEHAPGLTTTEIYKGLFHSNKSAAQVTRAIRILQDKGLIATRKEKAGRKTVEVFFVKPEV